MKVRKQVYELMLDDLAKHPVWEFALDQEKVENLFSETSLPMICARSSAG